MSTISFAHCYTHRCRKYDTFLFYFFYCYSDFLGTNHEETRVRKSDGKMGAYRRWDLASYINLELKVPNKHELHYPWRFDFLDPLRGRASISNSPFWSGFPLCSSFPRVKCKTERSDSNSSRKKICYSADLVAISSRNDYVALLNSPDMD